MNISEQGIALITKFEGFSEKPYRCPAGKLTIGFGHVILSDESHLSQGICMDDAQALLRKDVQFAEDAINRLVKVVLNQSQFDALVCFIYNVGVKAFEHSTLLKLLNDGDYAAVSRQLGKWVYAKGKKLEGLVTRRAAESKLFLEES